ncbi:MAG: hypothetical protein PHO26_05615 [Dehalococcoidia bacterium]|nr:hypothetical protein [Dehalococcoidia bacterium]MDD5493273.1 hypothetical protein [Dehalococcoidia bacterium]
MKHKHKLLIIFLAGASILFSIMSCNTVPSGQPSDSNPADHTPVISTIAGALEWKPGQEGVLRCPVSNPDKDVLTFVWSAENGTIKGDGEEVTWIAPDTEGEYAVTVKVSNSKGAEATATRKFKVTNNPYGNIEPDKTIYLKINLPSKEVVKESRRVRIWTTSIIQCVPQNSDLEQLTFKWTAHEGRLAANNLNAGTADSVGWIAPGVKGNYTVSVFVTDKTGNEASGQVEFDVFCCGSE